METNQTQMKTDGKTSKRDWKERYQKVKTWADGKALVDELSMGETQELARSLILVDFYMGLDLRQQHFQIYLENKIKYGGEKNDN
jgi:hypothetical protein